MESESSAGTCIYSSYTLHFLHSVIDFRPESRDSRLQRDWVLTEIMGHSARTTAKTSTTTLRQHRIPHNLLWKHIFFSFCGELVNVCCEHCSPVDGLMNLIEPCSSASHSRLHFVHWVVSSIHRSCDWEKMKSANSYPKWRQMVHSAQTSVHGAAGRS